MEEKKEEVVDEEKLKEKSRKISIAEGSANSLADGFGTKYITPYALAIGANNMYIGLLSSIPSFVGNFSQIFSSKLIEKFSRKKIVFCGALLQSIMWLFILSAGILFFVFNLKTSSHITLVLIYTILILFGAIITPAWNSWMKDLVPRNPGKYFGKRNRIIGTISLICMLIGSFILDYFKHTKIFLGFIVLFSISFIARGISAYLFTKEYEPNLQLQKGYYFTFWQFIKKIPQSNFGKFVVFVALINFATAIASPFFAVYMLKNLGFNYTQWIVIVIASSLAALLFLVPWGRLADKHGNLKVIQISGALVFLVPALWLIASLVLGENHKFLFIILILIESFSGLIWAGFNLSAANFIYDAVTRDRMALCVAYSNVLNGCGVFLGATIGGFLSSRTIVFFGLSPLLFVFFISGVLRLLVYIIMIPKIKEVREVPKFGIKEAKERFLVLTPKPILKYFHEKSY